MLSSSYVTAVTFIAVVFAAYSAVMHSRFRGAALLSVPAAGVLTAAIFPTTTPPLPGRFTALLVLIPVVIVGDAMHLWRRRAGDSQAQIISLQAEHEAATRRAVELERARVASELHDVVTHNVSVMVVFSGTATIEGERFRVFAEPVPGTRSVAVAATSIGEDQVSVTLRTSTTSLIIGGAVLVLIGGLGAYWLAAAALSPVERMRREVAALSAQDARSGVQVPRTRDEVAALAGTMNGLLARLHEALARQRGFVADASHELRTPLAVLGAELELAGRPGRSREDLAEAVASADDEVARLTRLTNDLLLLARSDEGNLPVRPAPTRVRELLERSAERVAGRAAAAGVSCAVDAPAGLVAQLDEDRVRQAVDNLTDNALQFAPPGTQIWISGRAIGTGLVIEVADAGPGFPADFLPHAFERFGRPDAERARSAGGAGLGLAIVAAVAAAHGGSASARNVPAGGAIVSLELPGVLGGSAG